MKLLFLSISLIFVSSINTLIQSDGPFRLSILKRVNQKRINEHYNPWLSSSNYSTDSNEQQSICPKIGDIYDLMNKTVCLAIVLNEYHLVTTSFCALSFLDTNSKNLKISIREIDKLIKVKNVIFHPKFRSNPRIYNLEILKLKTKLNFNEFFESTCFKMDDKTNFRNLIAGISKKNIKILC